MQKGAKKVNMVIQRDKYLNELINKKGNGLIKVITGLRRSGKSYLLFTLFDNYLKSIGISEEHILKFAFDNDEDLEKLDSYFPDEPTKVFDRKTNSYLINSKKFRSYIHDLTIKDGYYYLLLDEIQLLEDFVGTLNGFLRHDNFDTYVTGSNSKMLSSDVITEFRGRGDRIGLLPLSFSEFYSAFNGSFADAYKLYSYFGGMPMIASLISENDKSRYLFDLYKETYKKDIIGRYKIEDSFAFDALVKIIASSIGSYTNPTKLENTFKSEIGKNYSHITIQNHLDFLEDSFLIRKVSRYDIKGKKYINANYKYYFSDIGIRNSLLNFRQQEPNHIMENIIYNELLYRGYDVDVGIVEAVEKNKNNNSIKKQLEVDFVVNDINSKFYIQSVYSIDDMYKKNQEEKSLLKINDGFRKIIILNDNFKSYYNEQGILVISLEDFLLNRVKID